MIIKPTGQPKGITLDEMRNHEGARITASALSRLANLKPEPAKEQLDLLVKERLLARIDDEHLGIVYVYLRGFEGKGNDLQNRFAVIFWENAKRFGSVKRAISLETHRKFLDQEYGWQDTGHILAAVSAIMLVVPKGGKVLGIGAGAGEIAQFLALAGYKPLITDNTPEYIDVGKKAGLKEVRVEDARTLAGVPDHSMDALVMDHFIAAGYPVLSIQEEEQVMKSVKRVLVPGGYIICERTNPERLAELMGNDGEIVQKRLFPGSMLTIARLK